jgi:hypothetical protein
MLLKPNYFNAARRHDLEIFLTHGGVEEIFGTKPV